METEEIKKFVEEKIPKSEGINTLLLLEIRDLLKKLILKNE